MMTCYIFPLLYQGQNIINQIHRETAYRAGDDEVEIRRHEADQAGGHIGGKILFEVNTKHLYKMYFAFHFLKFKPKLLSSFFIYPSILTTLSYKATCENQLKK